MSTDLQKIKQEQVVFLRNQDIFSTTQRGVTTTNATGSLSGENTITIAVTNVKNIRSVEVASVAKELGTDYEVNYEHASGCVITFTSNQTGAYEVSYDYGNDKIYPDFPRDDLNINSYPRIAIDILSMTTEPFGIGGDDFISDLTFTVVVYGNNSDALDGYINSIRNAYITNAKTFYYLHWVHPILVGPTINSPDKKDEIMQKNLDVIGRFIVD